MPRLISFFLTTPQFIAGTKDVTRRMGWLGAKAGDELEAVEKGQGIPKGEHVKRLGLIRLVDVRREKLSRMVTDMRYGRRETIREGFPHWEPDQFVNFFRKANKCEFHAEVTRLEFVKL